MNITPCSLGWYKERLRSRGSKQNDRLNSVVKGTFPLTDPLLKGRGSLSCLFSMKIAISLLRMEIVWWQRSQSLPGVAEYIWIHSAVCVTKKKMNLLAKDSSNIISHEAFRENDELQRENILGKAMSSESVPHCRELSGWVISLTVYEPC